MEKAPGAIQGGHKRVAIGDRHNMAFQSTTVARGRGVGVVVNTGRTTEIGRISAAIAGTHVGKTPLQKKLEGLGKVLVLLAAIACALVVAAGFAWDPKDTGIVKVGSRGVCFIIGWVLFGGP
jgi:Ca2+-transporting ATPase